MDVAAISFADFQSICRGCLCDCNNRISFNMQDSLVLNNFASDVLSKCSWIQVRNTTDQKDSEFVSKYDRFKCGKNSFVLFCLS